MATPIHLLDPSAVMSYGGLVDATTVDGQLDEPVDWCGAIAALLTVTVAREDAGARGLPRRDVPSARSLHAADADCGGELCHDRAAIAHFLRRFVEAG